MIDVLKEFNPDLFTGTYAYCEVISVGSGGNIKIRTASGLEMSVRDAGQAYAVGDQLVLGVRDGNMNSIFIIRKLVRMHPAATNMVVSIGQG